LDLVNGAFSVQRIDLVHAVPSFSSIPFASPDMFLLTYNELNDANEMMSQASSLLSVAQSHAGNDDRRHTTLSCTGILQTTDGLRDDTVLT
jgi:hypothetical protein